MPKKRKLPKILNFEEYFLFFPKGYYRNFTSLSEYSEINI